MALYELISPSISQYNNQGKTTAPPTLCPTLYDKRVGSFTFPANHFNTEDAGDRDGLLTIIPRARICSKSIVHEAEGQMGY